MKSKHKSLAFSLLKEGVKAFFIGWGISILILFLAALSIPEVWDSITTLQSWTGYYSIIGGNETVKGTVLLIQIIGMLFYNSHWIPVEFQALGTQISARATLRTLNMVLEIAKIHEIFLIVFLAPIISIFLSGRSLAKGQKAFKLHGAKIGAMLAIPYAVIMVMGKFLFSITWSYSIFGLNTTLSIGPALDYTILMAILLSVIFGCIGGFLGGKHKPQHPVPMHETSPQE